MKPIVLVGGGEIHYRLIQQLESKRLQGRPILLVYNGVNKFVPLDFYGPMIASLSYGRSLSVDLWATCRRKGIYLLEDECLSIDRDERRLQLKKYGQLDYYRLSIDTQAQPTLSGFDTQDLPFVFVCTEHKAFFKNLDQFFSEVHRHCPRELRVLMTGCSLETLSMAFAMQMTLTKSCEASEVVIVDSQKWHHKGWFGGARSKLIAAFEPYGIRVIDQSSITQHRPQQIQLSGGQIMDYDIAIPFDHWRSHNFVEKVFEMEGGMLSVDRSLRDVFDSQTFIHGRNVCFERESIRVSDLDQQEVTQVLLENIFREDEQTPLIKCRNVEKITQSQIFPNPIAVKKWQLTKRRSAWLENWRKMIEKQSAQWNFSEVEPKTQQELSQALQYQAEQMSLPWQGIVRSTSDPSYQLQSFNGFNSWGSHTYSTKKICEMAILKCFVKGVRPQHMRFNLTLQDNQIQFGSHVFESTLRAIEELCERYNIQLNGGDTFNGRCWRLGITLGGELVGKSLPRFEAHDYLLLTRPLGYGYLWAGQLSESFDSSWFEAARRQQLLFDFDSYRSFVESCQPSGGVLIEEWGFLYHCLQNLPAHQQLNINFREVPRWKGVDQLVKQNIDHPGFEANWRRLRNDVAFRREDVSKMNSVMWDSLSQGALVFGVKAEKWQQAVDQLRQMGYPMACLIGCVRPKTKGNRIVLSDWSPN